MSRGNFLKYNLYQKLYSKKYNFPIGLYIQQARIEFSLSLPCDFGVEAKSHNKSLSPVLPGIFYFTLPNYCPIVSNQISTIM
jgi:hypothetical protein